MAAAQDRILKEMGTYSVPEVEINEGGNTVYSFKALYEEKKVLEKYRAGIDPNAASLGKTIFDSE
jgi:heme oxygenase